MRKRRKLIEEPSYERATAQFGGAQSIDWALEPMVDIIAASPDSFPVVNGFSPLRIAKTKLAVRDLEVIPSLRVWFYISNDDESVHLWWVEITPPDDMGIDDDLAF